MYSQFQQRMNNYYLNPYQNVMPYYNPTLQHILPAQSHMGQENNNFTNNQFTTNTNLNQNTNTNQLSNSQIDEYNNFTQILKNNLEENLIKIPEKFCSILMNKLSKKFEENKILIKEFKYKVKGINMKKDNKNSEKIISKIRNLLSNLEIKLEELIENQKNSDTLIEKYLKNQTDLMFEGISHQKKNESMLNEFRDRIEIIKFDLSQVICIINDKIFSNLELEKEYDQEVVNLIISKFKQIAEEIKIVNKEEEIYKIDQNLHECLVNKFKTINFFLENIENNNKIKGINRLNFSITSCYHNTYKKDRSGTFTHEDTQVREVKQCIEATNAAEERKINGARLKNFCFYN